MTVVVGLAAAGGAALLATAANNGAWHQQGGTTAEVQGALVKDGGSCWQLAAVGKDNKSGGSDDHSMLVLFCVCVCRYLDTANGLFASFFLITH
jgi:hypothetical protein